MLTFATPLALLALPILPVLWWVLRAVPPQPKRTTFSGLSLLKGLKQSDSETKHTPPWILALRMIALAALIFACAGPRISAQQAQNTTDAPLVIVMEGSWASARDWDARIETLEVQLQQAGNRPVALQVLTAPLSPVSFQTSSALRQTIKGLTPMPYRAQTDDVNAWLSALPAEAEVLWFSDGLLRDLDPSNMPDRIIEPQTALLALGAVTLVDGQITVALHRLSLSNTALLAQQAVTIRAIGHGPQGGRALLASTSAQLEAGEQHSDVQIILPPQVRNRIERIEIEGMRHGGAVLLTGNKLRRKQIGLVTGLASGAPQNLLDPLHYLRQAFERAGDVTQGGLDRIMMSRPDIIVFADLDRLAASEEQQMLKWVEDGGTILRFAGPQLAQYEADLSDPDPLMPIRLRQGGRGIGGTLSWGTPQRIAPFDSTGPLAGLSIPQDVTVSRQILADPDPNLSARTLASLEDGTPLITRKAIGAGQVVLVHVTATPDWSNLPLSGLFLDILDRLSQLTAPSPVLSEISGRIWSPLLLMKYGFGETSRDTLQPAVDGAQLAQAPLGPDLLPGLYQSGSDVAARNIITTRTDLTAARWPTTVPILNMAPPKDQPLTAFLIGLASLCIFIDLLVGTRIPILRSSAIVITAFILTPSAEANEVPSAASEVTLAFVITGDARVDELSQAGLQGLSNVLRQRTSVEPAPPVGLTLAETNLALYPMIYWPITTGQDAPSAAAYGRISAYLRSGGMIVFDTRDSDIGQLGKTSAARELARLTDPLNLPRLAPLDEDHVLRRSFYLIDTFPGRHAEGIPWLQAPLQNANQMNDGVSPVVIGGNDWAAAWAQNDAGRTLVPIGTGRRGALQREMAYRFGVNLVLYVLSGNYKSDQVHIPTLLQRLGEK